MPASEKLAAMAAILLLAGCEARIGKEAGKAKDQEAGRPARASAEARAEEGQLSIDAPGFALKLDIPAGLAERADLDSDSGILYPGAALSGMHVEARDRAGAGRSMVELRFVSSDPPAKVAAWYRDPARAKDFSVSSSRREGGAIAIAGTEKEDGDPFDLTLSPRSGGGTDGRLRLRDSG